MNEQSAGSGSGSGSGHRPSGPLVEVFSATRSRERDELGAKIVRWLREHPGALVEDVVVTQSSDAEFHCLTVTLFCTDLAPRGPGQVDVVDVVEVFSATKIGDREILGSEVTEWCRANPDVQIRRKFVVQSSDDSFHCVSIVLLGAGPVRVSGSSIRSRRRIPRA